MDRLFDVTWHLIYIAWTTFIAAVSLLSENHGEPAAIRSALFWSWLDLWCGSTLFTLPTHESRRVWDADSLVLSVTTHVRPWQDVDLKISLDKKRFLQCETDEQANSTKTCIPHTVCDTNKWQEKSANCNCFVNSFKNEQLSINMTWYDNSLIKLINLYKKKSNKQTLLC